MIGCLTESIRTQESKDNILKPRTNLQTYSQKEASQVMNGIIFLVAIDFFQTEGSEKQSAMPKRGHEGTSRESSAMAKPRSMNLVMEADMLSKKKDSPRDMSDSENQGNAMAEMDQRG